MRGLPNFGNTCYINSILQIIFNTAGVVLLAKDSEIARLYTGYHSEGDWSPDLLVKFIRTSNVFSGMQGDQHEFLMELMTIIHEDQCEKMSFNLVPYEPLLTALDTAALQSFQLNGLTGKGENLKNCDYGYMSPIVSAFTGQVKAETVCPCGGISNRFDTFRAVELSLPSTGSAPSTPSASSTLEECIKAFNTPEIIAGYTCDACQNATNAVHSVAFWRLPPIMIFTLKRTGNTGAKNNAVIQAPDILDLRPYVLRSSKCSPTYRLYAVAHHSGWANYGHCFSSVRKNDIWYTINDGNIGLLPERQNSPTDYMYFYERVPQ